MRFPSAGFCTSCATAPWRNACLIFACVSIGPGATADEAGWRALAEPGTVLIMRHALAPGTGDPPGFVLEDCATQRNLSERGRQEARRFGAALERRGIGVDRVFSSQWCRCLETARLLGVAPVEPLPALNSFYEDRDSESARTSALREFLPALDANQKTVLVSHQVNIAALTGILPASGEAVVLRVGASGEIAVLGRIGPVE